MHCTLPQNTEYCKIGYDKIRSRSTRTDVQYQCNMYKYVKTIRYEHLLYIKEYTRKLQLKNVTVGNAVGWWVLCILCLQKAMSET